MEKSEEKAYLYSNLLYMEEQTLDDRPLSRVRFYESGSKYISLIEQSEPRVVDDIEQLFYEMNKGFY